MLERPAVPQRSDQSWSECLTQAGIGGVDQAFTDETITRWNQRLDPFFSSQRDNRSYVGVNALADIGLIEECINEPIRELISSVTTSPRIYHCHVYEIDDRMDRPHIHADHADGWHRDTETIRRFNPHRAQHVSLFVYLSDVDLDGGAFEFLPQVPSMTPPREAKAHRVVGPPGTAFAWNRSYYHRASPNLSTTRRRVFKLSWQDADLPNDKIGGSDFRYAADRLAHDEFLSALFAMDASAALPACSAPRQPAGLPLNSSLAIRRSDQVLERVRLLRHQVLR
jgi:hypothetical protein